MASIARSRPLTSQGVVRCSSIRKPSAATSATPWLVQLRDGIPASSSARYDAARTDGRPSSFSAGRCRRAAGPSPGPCSATVDVGHSRPPHLGWLSRRTPPSPSSIATARLLRRPRSGDYDPASWRSRVPGCCGPTSSSAGRLLRPSAGRDPPHVLALAPDRRRPPSGRHRPAFGRPWPAWARASVGRVHAGGDLGARACSPIWLATD